MISEARAPERALRVLVRAPAGRDAEVLVDLLRAGGMDAEACASMAELCRRIEEGAGAAVVAAEALSGEASRELEDVLIRQPEWSDFPLIIMSARHSGRGPGWSFAREDAVFPAVVLERPVYGGTLLSVVRSALRSRSRQYQVRDQLLERQRAEEALRESEARFREMADGLPLIIWVHDASGTQEMVNQTFCEFFGVSREEMRGGRWQMLMHPEDADAYAAEFAACLRDRRPFHGEVRVKRADGAWRWIESWGRPRFTGSGEFSGFVGTSADVTERKRAEEQLREADRRKDEFLAILAHELRNPLAAIKNATDLTRVSASRDPLLQRAHGALERQSAHMNRLIDGLLEVSRISRGKIHLEREIRDLAKIIEGVLQDRSPQMEERGLELGTDLPPGPLWVWGDPVRLAQVVDNIVGNAIKFTDAPGRITVALQEKDGGAVLRVRDTGVGIRPERIPGLFEPFQQETQSARGGGGLGLGLALAKGLVELHAGSIEARSAGPGTGTEVEVRLPLTSAPAEERRPARAPEVVPRKILLVEDNADAGQMLRELMEIHGHDVTLVETGAEALDVLRRRGADVVFCDLGLPDMSGYEVSRAIRSDPELREVIVVALTGYGQPEDQRQTSEAGFDAHLTKPADIQDLHGLLGRLPS